MHKRVYVVLLEPHTLVGVGTHALFTTPPTVIQFALVSAMPNARGKGLQFLYAER